MKRKILVISALIVAIGLVAVFAVPFMMSAINERREERQLEAELIRQAELADAFWLQNAYFACIVNSELGGIQTTFMPINLRYPQIDGVAVNIYINLVLYEKQTGNILTYEQISDYLSQEFEDDGEVRIWTNGHHPEIAEYLEWASRSVGRGDFLDDFLAIYDAYAIENEGFPIGHWRLLPLEMVHEILRKEADPDYVMDLTTIQNRFIEEGRAVVSEDGLTIEFIVPES